MLWYTSVETALGWLGLVEGAKGLIRVFLPLPNKDKMNALIRREFPDAVESAGTLGPMVRAWQAYFQGRKVIPLGALDWTGYTDFQVEVWKLTQAIPWGEVRTYQWVSDALQKPGSARAVGGALGRNPFPIVVPCHRVVRRDGSLGGFTAPGGIALKRLLLEKEGVLFDPRGKVCLRNTKRGRQHVQ